MQNFFYVSQYAENHFSTYPHNMGILQNKVCIARILLPFTEFTDVLQLVAKIFFQVPALGITLTEATFQPQGSRSIHLRRATYWSTHLLSWDNTGRFIQNSRKKWKNRPRSSWIRFANLFEGSTIPSEPNRPMSSGSKDIFFFITSNHSRDVVEFVDFCGGGSNLFLLKRKIGKTRFICQKSWLFRP